VARIYRMVALLYLEVSYIGKTFIKLAIPFCFISSSSKSCSRLNGRDRGKRYCYLWYCNVPRFNISTSFGHKRGSNRDILLEKKRGCQLNYVLWQIQYTSSHDHLSYGIFSSTLDRPRLHILAILVWRRSVYIYRHAKIFSTCLKLCRLMGLIYCECFRCKTLQFVGCAPSKW